jgi:hypothetical protein
VGELRPGAVIRVSDADRRDTVDRLDVALREGRLGEEEHGDRVGAARAAKLPAQLAALVADLPRRLGTHEWEQRLRVRASDRERATGWLDDALAEGRLTAAEHDRRLALVAGAVAYASLRKAVDGVPGPPGARRERLFVAGADREWLTARLARALADGRIGPADHGNMRAAAAAATRYEALDKVSSALAHLLRRDVRAEAIRRLDEALADGRIRPAEHDRRVPAVRQATRNAVVRQQLRGIPPARGATPEWIVGQATAVLAGRPVSDTERARALRALGRARQEGRLDMDEYDERVAAAYAAQDTAELRSPLVDLVVPAPVGPVPDDPVPDDRVPDDPVPEDQAPQDEPARAGKREERGKPRKWWRLLMAVLVAVVLAGSAAVWHFRAP